MNKMVGAAEFKKNCLRIMEEASRNGETILITKRGKPFMEMKRAATGERKLLFGFMKGTVTFAPDFEPDESPFDPDWEEQWDANNPPELYSRR